jgi:hypothetical protein
MDIYESGKTSAGDAGLDVFEQAQTSGQNRAQRFFNNSAMNRKMASRGQLTGDYIKGAIALFGADQVRDWKNTGQQIMKDLERDLEDAQYQAIRARKINDLKVYRQQLKRMLHDKQMQAYANMLEKNKNSDIFSTIIGGIGSVGLAGWDAFKSKSFTPADTNPGLSDTRGF